MLQSVVQRDHPQASVRLQCRLLGVCRSGLYYQPQAVDPEQLAQMRRIDELYTAHQSYGSRQMSGHLRREGYPAGRDQVRRLMRKMGLQAVYCRPRTSLPDYRVTIRLGAATAGGFREVSWRWAARVLCRCRTLATTG